jgi:ABC-type uncharacterized transport system
MARVALGTSRWTRLAIGLQVAAIVLLAAAAAVLATWLAGRPGLRWRADLTATQRNTLDPALARIVAQLPEPATIEVFWRPVSEPFWRELVEDAQQRTSELLFVASNQFSDRLKVIDHAFTDVAAANQRLQELGVQEPNVVVVQCGKGRKVLKLLRDLVRVDPGNAQMRTPPRIESFRGDQALGEALLEVSRGERVRVLFAHGHGERDPFARELGGLSELRAALVSDGFEVENWDPEKTPDVPADCGVLALVDPRQPYPPAVLDAIEAYVSGGGRLFAVPSRANEVLDGAGTEGELLRRFGVLVQPGFAAQPRPNVFGQLVEGDSRVNPVLAIPNTGLSPRHPITEPLQRLGFALQNVAGARTFRSGQAPPEGRMDTLVETPTESWLDLPDAQGVQDWRFNRERGELPGPLTIALAVELAASGEAPPANELAPRRAGRVVAFGSAEVLSDGPFPYARDFALNAFNWLAERDWRLNVQPRDRDQRKLDLVNTHALSTINRVATFGLPGLCALLGCFLAWRRRR